MQIVRSRFASWSRFVLLAVDRHDRIVLISVLVLGLLARLPLAIFDFKTTYDMRIFQDWARTAQAYGLSSLYGGSGMADYPPLLLYFMSGAAWITDRLPGALGGADEALTALIKLPPILADLATAGLIAWVLRSRSPRVAIGVASAYLFNPAIWYVSAHFSQTDSIYTLFLLVSVLALESSAILPAWLAYALAFMTKFQSVAIAPLVLAMTYFSKGIRGLALGSIGALGVLGALTTPWWLNGRLGDVFDMYRAFPNEPTRTTVSAYNLWYLLPQGQSFTVPSQDHPLGLPLSYQMIGFLLFGAYALLVAVLADRGRFLSLAGAALSLALFTLVTQMHERHLFPALAFLALAAAVRPRLWGAYVALSATFFFNLSTFGLFTPSLGPDIIVPVLDTPLVSALKALTFLAAMVNLLVLAWLAFELAKDVVPALLRRQEPEYQRPDSTSTYVPDYQPVQAVSAEHQALPANQGDEGEDRQLFS